MREIKTNDEARELIEAAGITVENVTDDQLVMLWQSLRSRLRNSGNYNGTYKMDTPTDLMFMTCSTEQWDEREAVSFNRDGFIGFAGWADSSNVKPILKGVSDWLEKINDKVEI